MQRGTLAGTRLRTELRDVAADMARMAADPVTQRWWDVCKPCQQPLADRAPDEWWAAMDEVFHQD